MIINEWSNKWILVLVSQASVGLNHALSKTKQNKKLPTYRQKPKQTQKLPEDLSLGNLLF